MYIGMQRTITALSSLHAKSSIQYAPISTEALSFLFLKKAEIKTQVTTQDSNDLVILRTIIPKGAKSVSENVVFANP
jgi:hypothetical protein